MEKTAQVVAVCVMFFAILMLATVPAKILREEFVPLLSAPSTNILEISRQPTTATAWANPLEEMKAARDYEELPELFVYGPTRAMSIVEIKNDSCRTLIASFNEGRGLKFVVTLQPREKREMELPPAWYDIEATTLIPGHPFHWVGAREIEMQTRYGLRLGVVEISEDCPSV